MGIALKSVLAALVLCLPAVASAQEPPAQDASAPSAEHLAIARQIIAIGFPEDTREAAFFATMDQMVSQTREASLKAYGPDDAGVREILDQWISEYVAESKGVLRSHIPALMEGMAASYAATFTEQELRDILAFVSSPSGQRFFALSSAVLAEPNFAAANQAYMNEIQARMPAAIEDLVGRITDYSRGREGAGPPSES